MILGWLFSDCVRSFFLSTGYLGDCSERGTRGLAQEADQPFNVLRRRSQEELFAHELHAAQAQTAQADLVLQLRKQSLDLFSLSLCPGKLTCVGQLSCPLSADS